MQLIFPGLTDITAKLEYRAGGEGEEGGGGECEYMCMCTHTQNGRVDIPKVITPGKIFKD